MWITISPRCLHLCTRRRIRQPSNARGSQATHSTWERWRPVSCDTLALPPFGGSKQVLPEFCVGLSQLTSLVRDVHNHERTRKDNEALEPQRKRLTVLLEQRITPNRRGGHVNGRNYKQRGRLLTKLHKPPPCASRPVQGQSRPSRGRNSRLSQLCRQASGPETVDIRCDCTAYDLLPLLRNKTERLRITIRLTQRNLRLSEAS
jgi:hypothetical protein